MPAADHAASRPQARRKTAGDAEADQSAATGRHRMRQVRREMLAVTAANDRNAKARRDASLEGHTHHYNHPHAPPGIYIPNDTTRLLPLFRLR